jgi:AraC-like DNA-binding protein
MKPVLMRHIEAVNESFKAWKNAGPYLHNPWHYHPEIEITFITKGKGILFVGDKILNYAESELVMIGADLPHEWRSNIKEEPDNYSESIAVHFKKNFPGEEFYRMPEAIAIKDLLDKSARGISVQDENTKEAVHGKLMLLLQTKGIERINILFSILNSISGSAKLAMLSSPTFVTSIHDGEADRMNVIYKFIMTNFKDKVSLDLIAQQVNMTNASFCRFFKERTHKSFIQYINEIRLGYACKLLVEKDYSISQVAYESGFENISNFNKQFKKVKQITPSQFVSLLSKNEK